MQVARTAEAQKRVTTGSGDAQNNAALAVYSIEWDLKQAGYGFNSTNLMGHSLTLPNEHEYDSSPEPVQLDLTAVSINPTSAGFPFPAALGGADKLLLAHGNSSAPLPLPGGARVNLLAPCGDKLCIGLESISSSFFAKDDQIVLAPGEIDDIVCKRIMGKISDEPEAPSTGDDNRSGMIKVEVPGGASAAVSGAVDANCLLFNLGKKPRFVGYAVNSDGLARCDYLESNCANAENWEIIVNGIVSLKAELVGVGDSSVRFALVVRNSEPDREEVTTASPTWNDGEAIDVSGVPVPTGFSWQNYRYQVYETVVPLMNVLWKQ
jgi:type IV pilus assembly protein PilW